MKIILDETTMTKNLDTKKNDYFNISFASLRLWYAMKRA